MVGLYSLIRSSSVPTSSKIDMAISLLDRINGYASLKNIVDNTVSVIASDAIGFRGSGSGLYFSEKGYVLTASHIALEMSRAPQAHVHFADGLVRRVESIEWRSQYCDAAILKIEQLQDKTEPNIRFSRTDGITEGMAVTTIGYHPTGRYTLRGIVTGTEGIITSPDSFDTSVLAIEGFSGGSIVNKKGEVIGINSYKLFGQLGAARIYSVLPEIDRVLNQGQQR